MLIITIILSVMCGVAFFTGIHHSIIALRLKKPFLHYIVVTLSLISIGYISLTFLEYRTDNPENYIKLLKIQSFFTNFSLICLLWLITYYTGHKKSTFHMVLTGLFILFPFLRLIHPTSLTLKNVEGIKNFTLPWGEDIFLIQAGTTIWGYLFYFMILILYIFIVYMIIKNLKKQRVWQNITLLGGVIVFLLCNINDIFVVTLNLKWLFLSELGVLSILLTVSIYASNDILTISILKDNLKRVNFELNAKNEELSATNEELEAANEEFEAQNMELMRNEEEKQKMQHQLFQAQKMEAVGTLAGGLAHNFNNLLSGILGSFNLLQVYLKKENLKNINDIETSMQTGIEACHRSAEIIKELMVLSRQNELKLEFVNIATVIKHVKNICKNSFPKSIELQIDDSDKNINVMADAVQLEQVLLNICVNASHSMTIMRKESEVHGGILKVNYDTISTHGYIEKKYPSLSGSDTCCKISISDTGIGISPDLKDRIFEPFFSTKKEWGGSGLGLTMTYSIIEKHNGFIEIHSEVNSGTTLNIYLPLVTEQNKIHLNEKENKIIEGEGTILIVDDELYILEITENLLKECGYKSITENTPRRAIEIYKKKHDEIDLVIVDLFMPMMTGIDLFLELKKINKNIKCIIISGTLDKPNIDKALNYGILDFLNKPYTLEEISQKVYNAIKGRNKEETF